MKTALRDPWTYIVVIFCLALGALLGHWLAYL